MNIVELYVIIDDFCKKFTPKYLKLLKNKDLIRRNRANILTASEIILIMLLFTQFGYKFFKWFYENKILVEYKSYFKKLPTYNRFLELIPKHLIILFRFLQYSMYIARRYSIIEYIDSIKVPVCHNKRTNLIKYFLVLQILENQLWVGFLGLSYTLHVILMVN